MGLARTFSILLLTIVLPTAAAAVELDLTAEVSTLYDDNVFRGKRNENRKGDMSIRFGPAMHLHSQEKDLGYSIRYRPVYEKFVSSSDIDSVSHLARGEMTYSLSPKTKMTLRDRFAFTQTVNRIDVVLDGDVLPDSEVARADIYRNYANAELSHYFTSRMTGNFVASHDLFDSERLEVAKNTSTAGIVSLSYAVDARNRVGLGGGVTWQDFRRARGRPASETLVYRSFASWTRSFGDSTELSLRGGPAFIRTERDLLATSTVSEDDESRFTWFGEVRLTKSWSDKLISTASYNRSDGSSSSLGASTIAERVTLLSTWSPSDRWDLNLRGDWLSRESANETEFITGSTVDNVIDTEYWAVSSRASYRASRRIKVSLRVTYQDQKSNRGDLSGTASNASYNNVLVFLNFRYDFDPIHL